MDGMHDMEMVVEFDCEYPCRECIGRNFCTECWPSYGTVPGYLTNGFCQMHCDFGYTTNGNWH